MAKRSIVIMLDNIRSAYNVGSIFRTADAVGAQMVVCCGLTPYPITQNDPRRTFEAEKTTARIAKTALGAEVSVPCRHFGATSEAIEHFRALNYQIVALEQAPNSVSLFGFKPQFPIVLTLGHEVQGHNLELLPQVDYIVEIPMSGAKESLNVSVAAGIALYQLSREPT